MTRPTTTSARVAERIHIAQVNVARMRALPDDPLMAGFFSRLDEINALADSSPGFVWRLESDAGPETVTCAGDDPYMIVNLSVWETLGALRDFVYNSLHRELILSRKQWFEAADGPHLALWPVAASHRPDVDEAHAWLAQLARNGPSDTVFTFATVPASLSS